MGLLNVPHFKEYLTTLCATLSMLSSGVHFGWPSPSIPILKGDDSPIPITNDQGSWIVSLIIFGCVFGPCLAGSLINKAGRKMIVVLSAIPYLTAWVMILVAESVAVLYVARFIAGFGNGITYTVVPIYLGEIASDRIRGALGTFVTTMSNLGVLIAYCLGPYVPFRILPYIMMVPPILLLLSHFILPETPYFHLMKHREKEAMASLKYLRGDKKIEELQAELDLMNISVKKDQENKAGVKELFNSKGNRKALIILFGCFFGQQLCGSQAVLGYAQEIFEETDSTMGPSETAIILGGVQLVVAIISSVVVDKMGRRPLLLLSTAGVTITLIIIGAYFFMMYYLKSDVSSISWLPVLSVMLYIILFTIGLATVPFALMGELFPTNVKGIATVPVIMVGSLLSFAVVKLYQVVSDSLGTYVSFWGFALFSFLALIHIFITLPETKNKSLTEIQTILNK